MSYTHVLCNKTAFAAWFLIGFKTVGKGVGLVFEGCKAPS